MKPIHILRNQRLTSETFDSRVVRLIGYLAGMVTFQRQSWLWSDTLGAKPTSSWVLGSLPSCPCSV